MKEMRERYHDLTFSCTIHNRARLKNWFAIDYSSMDDICFWEGEIKPSDIVIAFENLVGAVIEDYRKISFLRSSSMVLLGKQIPEDYVPKPFKDEPHFQEFKQKLILYMTNQCRPTFFKGLNLDKEEGKRGYDFHQTIVFHVQKNGEIKLDETPYSIGLCEEF